MMLPLLQHLVDMPEVMRADFGVSLILLVASFLLTELLRPKPKVEDARPAGLGDFKFPTATEGRVNPIVFGRVMLEGMNVTWYGNLLAVPIFTKIKKNLWSSFNATTGYQYFLGLQGGLCRGTLSAIRRFWIGESLVWTGNLTADGTISVDLPELFGGNSVGTGGVQMDLQVYMGSSSQTANDYLNTFQADVLIGSNTQPTYAGSAYVVARRLGGVGQTIPTLLAQLGQWAGGAYVGNSESIKPWKFEVERFPALFPGQTGTQNKIGSEGDCNPINVIYEYLTNAEWGRGFPAADIDTGASSSFLTAALTMITESNGFSFVLAADMESGDFIKEIERQIDGVVFINHRTGKWTIKLVRNDYDINTVPEFTDDNIRELQSYERGSWVETTNQLQVEFDHRANDYKLSNALAQDTANMLMQGGGTFSTLHVVAGKVKYPGVKNSLLASQIASRDLRSKSFPLARATVTTNRTFWQLTIGSPVAFTRAALGITKLAMRVLKIDFGTITNNAQTFWLVQDSFQFLDGAFSAPPATNWSAPVVTTSAYATNDQLAFEAPRAVLVRDPEYLGDPRVSKIMAAVRSSGGEISIQIGQRNAAGAPSGAYAVAGQIAGAIYAGELSTSLAAGVANPTSSITVLATPNTQTEIEASFDDTTTLAELGTGLAQLILIDSEFMLVRSAATSGANVLLQNVYRGALDSVQAAHAANARVYLIFLSSGLSDAVITNTYNVDVELRMQTESETFAGAVTAISFTMDKRPFRPYAAAAFLYNGAGSPFTTPSMEGAGSGLGGYRIDVAWWRRKFDTANEIDSLLADDTSVDASTDYQLTVRADPTGANTLVGAVSAWTAGPGPLQVTRADILTAAAAGTLLRFTLRTRHDYDVETAIESRYDLLHDVTPTSAFTGLFYFGGGVAVNVPTASYTAAATGTFTVNIGSVQSTAAIEVSLNGGAFASVIAAGLTTGTFSATSADTIRLRRTVNETPNPQVVELKNPSAATVAYGTFSG